MKHYLFSSLFAVLMASASAQSNAESNKVLPVSDALRKQFTLADSYTKALVLDGFPILSSAKVRDAALHEAAWVVRSMLKNRPDILRELAKNKVRLAIMAYDERTSDVPEHSDLKPAAYWNYRARGLGPTPYRPCVSCGEENLLNFPGDPYHTENILIHEFAHAVHDMALKTLDPTFDKRLEKAYQKAKNKGLWKGKYAMMNRQEYWAEATQSWFWNNRENDSLHNHVDTREELVAYDPAIAKLCAEVYGENTWRYLRSDHPARRGKGHLKNLDRNKLPTFKWSEKELKAYRDHEAKKK